MRKFRKLAALCAVFLIAVCCFSTVALAAPVDETAAPPAESETSSPSKDNISALLPPGTGTVVDVFTGEDGRKFYTIQTPAGNTFYLIIDFTKQAENVYFLDAVNEKDLLALAEKAKTASGGSAATDIDPDNPNTEPTPDKQTEPEQKDNTGNLIMFGVIFVVVIGGGAFYLIKSRKARKNTGSRDEYEADEPDEYIPDDYDTEPEDNSPPWEDEEE